MAPHMAWNDGREGFNRRLEVSGRPSTLLSNDPSNLHETHMNTFQNLYKCSNTFKDQKPLNFSLWFDPNWKDFELEIIKTLDFFILYLYLKSTHKTSILASSNATNASRALDQSKIHLKWPSKARLQWPIFGHFRPNFWPFRSFLSAMDLSRRSPKVP